MSYDQSKVAFIDTETTGLDPERHQIWEIAVIVDGEEHVWHQRLPRPSCGCPTVECPHDDPLASVSRWVMDNTGIRDRYDHDAALTPADSIDRFANLVYGRHLVGACPWFDSERLHRAQLAESDHRDLPWHYHLIDVENLAVGFLAGVECGITRAVGSLGYGSIGLCGLPWKSTELSLALGVDPADFEPKHSALADARWARAMYEAMMGEPT